MMADKQIVRTTSVLSASLTGDLAIERGGKVAVWFPTLTSCAAYFQVPVDATISAAYVRHNQAVESAGALAMLSEYPVGVGSLAVIVPGLEAYAKFRVEFSAPQEAVRSVAAIVSY
jgi:hypothetical protein